MPSKPYDIQLSSSISSEFATVRTKNALNYDPVDDLNYTTKRKLLWISSSHMIWNCRWQLTEPAHHKKRS